MECPQLHKLVMVAFPQHRVAMDLRMDLLRPKILLIPQLMGNNLTSHPVHQQVMDSLLCSLAMVSRLAMHNQILVLNGPHHRAMELVPRRLAMIHHMVHHLLPSLVMGRRHHLMDLMAVVTRSLKHIFLMAVQPGTFQVLRQFNKVLLPRLLPRVEDMYSVGVVITSNARFRPVWSRFLGA